MCIYLGCDAPAKALGLCAGHCGQHYRGEALRPILRGRTTSERFWTKVIKSEQCWQWVGAVGGHGYGNFWNGQYYRAHRWAYVELVGPIPDGLTLDHLCKNKLCVNPDHLEPVTQKINNERAGLTERLRAAKAAQIICKHGHPLSGDNLYVQPKSGYRYCRTCQKRRQAEYLVRKAAG